MARFNDRVAQFVDAGTYAASATVFPFVNLSGSLNGLRKLTDVLSNGDLVDYVITKGPNGSTAWEVSRGTYDDTLKTITRLTTPLSSSNVGAKVDFGTVGVDELLFTETMTADLVDELFTKNVFIFKATTSQTVFTGNDLRGNALFFNPEFPQHILVYVNGVLGVQAGVAGFDYALGGSDTVTFVTGLDVDSIVQMEVI